MEPWNNMRCYATNTNPIGLEQFAFTLPIDVSLDFHAIFLFAA